MKMTMDMTKSFERRCYCHYDISHKRFCFSRYYSRKSLASQILQMRRLAKQIKTGLDAWKLHDCIISTLNLINSSPLLDSLLGKFYMRTNVTYGVNPIGLFIRSVNVVDEILKTFVEEQHDVLFETKNVYRRLVQKKSLPGLLAASRLLDQVVNCINGIEENIFCVLFRMAAVLSQIIYKSNYLNFEQFSVIELFKKIFELISDHKIMFSLSLLSNIGLKKCNSSLFDNVFYAMDHYTLTDFSVINGSIFFPLMLNGVNISINITRYQYDFKWLYDIILSQVKITEIESNKSCNVTIYMDLWHISTLTMLSMLEELAVNESIRFAIIVPGVFMKRYKNCQNEKWTFFYRQTAAELSKITEEDFEKKYIEYEMTQPQINTTLESLISDIFEKIKTGLLSLVFRDNIVKFSILKEQVTSCLGCSLDCLPTNHGINVCNRSLINLTEFVKSNLEHTQFEFFDYVRIKEKYFDLHELREVVCELVILSNAIIDTAILKKDVLINGIEKSRALGISIAGLHSLFMILKIRFDSEEAIDLYKIISENIYYSAVRTSVDCCKNGGEICELFYNSKYKDGILYCDMFKTSLKLPNFLWSTLKEDVKTYGIRNIYFISNSLLEHECDILGVSPSICPIRANKILKKSKIKVTEVKNNDSYKQCVDLHILQIPVYNKYLIYDHSENMNKLAMIGFDVSNLKYEYDTWEKMNIFQCGFDYSIDSMLRMYCSALPFIDQIQSTIYYYVNEDDILNNFLKIYEAGFKVAIYKGIFKQRSYALKKQDNSCDLLRGKAGLVFDGINVVC